MNALDATRSLQQILGVTADGSIGAKTRAQLELLARTPGTSLWPPPTVDKGDLLTVIGGVKVYRTATGLIRWTSGVTIDADGAPDAYHPDDHPGRDALAAAGHPGNWWGLVCDDNGRPVIQGRNGVPAFSDATRGFYVSSTSLVDNPEFDRYDVRRYCNPDEVSGIVIPLRFPVKIRAGQKALVTYAGNTEEAIVFDFGPPGHLGEIGTKLAKKLGIPDSPRHGGVSEGVSFEVQT